MRTSLDSIVVGLDAEYSNEVLQEVLQTLPQGVMLCTALREPSGSICDFTITLANASVAFLTKRIDTPLTGRTLLQEFPQSKVDGTFARYVEVVLTGQSFTADQFFAETRNILRVVVAPLGDGILLTLSLLTENAEIMLEHRAEHDEQSNTVSHRLEQRFNAIFHNSFQFTYVVSTGGILLEINQTALNFAGLRAKDVIGLPFAAMNWWSDNTDNGTDKRANNAHDISTTKIQSALFRASGGEFVRYTTEFVSFEGTTATVDFSLKPIFNATGDIDFFVAEGRDITALKRVESERDKERQLADTFQKLNELKSEFVSNVSHELRTPLASIMGFAQTLLRDQNITPETARKFLNIILQDGQRLSRLVEDLLDLSRIESGKVELIKSSVNLNDIVEYVLHITSAEAASKGIRVECVLPKQPAIALLDRDRITQVLVNLLDNAVKFTPEQGTVSIGLLLPKSGKSALKPLFMRITIADTGVGIPEHEMSRLFEKFYRVSQKGKEIRGTGLGLAIAKQIVDLHNGEITVQSEVGKGSIFTIALPVE